MPTPYEQVVWSLGPAIARADIPGLCARLHALLREHPRATVRCDVRALDAAPGTVAIEALLRLQLTARRLGGEVRLCHVPEALDRLLTLTGLAEAFRTD